MFLSPNQTIAELGTKDEFEMSKVVDEDGDDLVGEKLEQERQDNLSQD